MKFFVFYNTKCTWPVLKFADNFWAGIKINFCINQILFCFVYFIQDLRLCLRHLYWKHEELNWEATVTHFHEHSGENTVMSSHPYHICMYMLYLTVIGGLNIQSNVKGLKNCTIKLSKLWRHSFTKCWPEKLNRPH